MLNKKLFTTLLCFRVILFTCNTIIYRLVKKVIMFV